MEYEHNFKGQKGLMREKYPGGFHPHRLTPNSYHGQDILEKDDVQKGEQVGVFLSGEKDSERKAYNIARHAVQRGADVTLFYRPRFFPEENGRAHDRDNTFALRVKDGQHIDDMLKGINVGAFQQYDLNALPGLDKAFFVTSYWNRNLRGIKNRAKKTIGYLGQISGDDDSELHYTMERYLMEHVDEFRADDAQNRQILEDRHHTLGKPVKLVNEEQTDLSGKKVLFIPEFPLQESMVARWRHEWPAEYLGESGARVGIRGALAPVLERDKNGNVVWKKSVQERAAREGKPFDDAYIRNAVLDGLKSHVDNADVVIFGRTNNKFTRDVFDYAKKAGKVVGYEIDDLIFGDDAIEGFKKKIPHDPEGKSMSEYIDEQIKAADFVTVSTGKLAEEAAKLRGGMKDVYVLKNRLHLDELPPLRLRPPKQEVRIGWAGSHHHIDKLIEMLPMFRNLYNRHGDRMKLVFKGLDEKKMAKDSDREKLGRFRAGLAGIPYEMHGYTEQKDWKDYYRDLRDLDLDIFIAPSKDDPEHQGKSELKYLEGSASGAATVAHAIGGHKDAIRHRDNGMLVDMADAARGNRQFEASIDELVRDDELRRGMQERAMMDVQKSYHTRLSSAELQKILIGEIRKRKGR
ncbi:MAG: glycosyltransferase family 4 protein [Nanoarchaeota archaeon]